MSEINTWPGWESVRKLGAGSFGSVYEIRRIDNGIEFKAALKVISIPRNASELQSAYSDGMDERSVTAYFRSMVDSITEEYAMMAQLKGHSNIVSYEDHMVIEHKEGIGWDILIRMELLTPLLSFAKDYPLSEQDVNKLGQDICCALDVCGKKKIIHRDIKPENIFVSSYGDFKLGDFGIARVAEKTISNMTKTGTYSYMAPEVYLNRPYGQTADIYSLGMVLYRFLNENRLPFYPKGVLTVTDKENALQRRMSGEAIPAPAHGGEALKRAVLGALEYEPEKRFRTARDFSRALSAHVVQLPDPTPPEDLSREGPPFQDGTINDPSLPPTPPGPPADPPRRNWLIPAVAVLGIAVLLGYLLFFLHPFGTKSTSGSDAPALAVSTEDTQHSDNAQEPTAQPTEAQTEATLVEALQEPTGYSDLALQTIAEIIDESEGLEARGDLDGALEKISTALEVYPESDDLNQRETSLQSKIASRAAAVTEAATEAATQTAKIGSSGGSTAVESIPWQGTLSKAKLHSIVTDPGNIETIQFLDTLEEAPSSAKDLSTKGDGSVLGWLEDGCVLYIAGRGGVTAPKDCSFLFSIDNAWDNAQGRWDHLAEVYGTEYFFTGNVTNMNGMFCYCKSLLDLDLNSWDTSNVTNMHRVFLHCNSLGSLDIGYWDTSKVTDMKWMFDSCYNLSYLDIAGWNTSRVTDMTYMFSRCPDLSVDISSWDLSSLNHDEEMIFKSPEG